MKKCITCIYIHIKHVRPAHKIMELTENDWGQRDIKDKIKILTKRGTYTINADILTKYHKISLNHNT